MHVFRNSKKEQHLVLDIYVGSHTDKEIEEFIKSITIETVIKGSRTEKKQQFL